MIPTRSLTVFGLGVLVFASAAGAVPLSPNCTADKTAKHAAEKATTGVSTNRCAPTKVAKDSGKNAVNDNQKGPIDKHTNDDTTKAQKAKDPAKN